MTKSLRLILALCFVSLISAVNFASAQQGAAAKSGTWSGVIVNSTCSADEAFAEAAECTRPGVAGAKLAVYDDTIRQIYVLDPQDQVIAHLGESVTVRGSLDGATLHINSIEPLTSIGLAVGQRAPAFSARDQFGNLQTLATLKGTRGTVLLFFRSADW